MRSMNELRPFYKLLSIPEDTAAPTPFQLLGLPVAPSAPLTREQIEQAVLERKKLLRQHIPGPQALPIMSLVEQTIDRAAARLLKHLGLAGGHSPEHAVPQTAGSSSTESPSGPVVPVEQPPRPVEHAPRSHPRSATAAPPGTEPWQDALQWVMSESRILYAQARAQNDLRSAAEALRTFLTARRFLHIIDKE
jgi:hypothetical protein